MFYFSIFHRSDFDLDISELSFTNLITDQVSELASLHPQEPRPKSLKSVISYHLSTGQGPC